MNLSSHASIILLHPFYKTSSDDRTADNINLERIDHINGEEGSAGLSIQVDGDDNNDDAIRPDNEHNGKSMDDEIEEDDKVEEGIDDDANSDINLDDGDKDKDKYEDEGKDKDNNSDGDEGNEGNGDGDEKGM